MTKIMIEIQGNLYDLWECRSLEQLDEYDDDTNEMKYLLVMNADAIATNYRNVRLFYPTEKMRDKELKNIKAQLIEFEGVILIHAGIPIQELKEAIEELRQAAEQRAEQEQDSGF